MEKLKFGRRRQNNCDVEDDELMGKQDDNGSDRSKGSKFSRLMRRSGLKKKTQRAKRKEAQKKAKRESNDEDVDSENETSDSSNAQQHYKKK
ncbi:unnamed protein product, partial [Mesorhabditis belari]|uniref:Uncharacterized protein n=1 Tax=Mesorhabditis belari TaxID=2138241 RepID=A0AAF3F919_9BILA